MVFNENGQRNGPNYDAPREMQDLPAGQAVSFSPFSLQQYGGWQLQCNSDLTGQLRLRQHLTPASLTGTCRKTINPNNRF
jgi:hypothetical protein